MNLLDNNGLLREDLANQYFEKGMFNYVSYVQEAIRRTDDAILKDQQCLQYFVSSIHTNHLRCAEWLYRNYVEEGKSYLNIGAGCGYVEKMFNDNDNPRIRGCDWQPTDWYFDYWRKYLEVNNLLTHDSGDLFNTEWEITGKKSGNKLDVKFDSIIAQRFNGWWRSEDTYKAHPRPFKEVLGFFREAKKFAPEMFVLILGMESPEKFSDESRNWLLDNVIQTYKPESPHFWATISLDNV